MDIRGQWSRKNTREISQQDSVDAYYKPIALSLSSNGYIFRPYKFGRTPVAVISAAGVKSILDIPEPYIFETNLKLKLGSGILIAVPIPKEHTASGGLIESAIYTKSERTHWHLVSFSCFLTPDFQIWEVLFSGHELDLVDLNSSLDIALVKNNALAGDKIAVALLRSRNILIELRWSLNSRYPQQYLYHFEINEVEKENGMLKSLGDKDSGT
ncbi:hypothetical protein NC652_022406 [Populus alba x Populus x berolinensis]|nr:hypothetical protein NC652_022406 [Populus alba x Populus x berolinensis]